MTTASIQTTHAESPELETGRELLVLNGRLEILELDEGGDRQRVLYRLPDINGRLQQIAVGITTHRWLQRFADGRCLDDVRRELLEGEDPEQVERFVQVVTSFLKPRRMLVSPTDNGTFAPTRPGKPSWMALKIRLLPGWLVERVTRHLVWSYDRAALATLMVVIIAGQAAFLAAQPVVSGQVAIGLGSEGILGVIALVFLGLLAHEFGHAAAARRYGCRNTEIGIGWYFYFPVFWADLSEAWRCSRGQRAVIDMGGTYYQAIFISGLMAAFWTTGQLVYFYASVVLNISLLFNINPFLRLDGYWLVSDLTGTPNLRRTASRAIGGLFSGRKTGDRQARWLVLYAIGANLFFVLVLYLLFKHVIWRVIGNIPPFLQDLLATLGSGTASIADTIVAVGLLLWQFIMIYFIGYLLVSVAGRLWQLGGGLRGRSGRRTSAPLAEKSADSFDTPTHRE
jgi:putative peptide zinc metalloprotease protein